MYSNETLCGYHYFMYLANKFGDLCSRWSKYFEKKIETKESLTLERPWENFLPVLKYMILKFLYNKLLRKLV